MKSELLRYISKFNVFNEEEIKSIIENTEVQKHNKGTILLKEGSISTKCYFVLKGCVRQYQLVNGEEKTTAFFTEEQSVVSFTSYTNKTPSSHYLSCAEDCILTIGSPAKEREMYQKIPKLKSFNNKLVEQGYGVIQQDFASFITASPEERYLNILNTRPKLLLRIPQHQIASYIGVTPESLSRIKNRVIMKNHI